MEVSFLIQHQEQMPSKFPISFAKLQSSHILGHAITIELNAYETLAPFLLPTTSGEVAMVHPVHFYLNASIKKSPLQEANQPPSNANLPMRRFEPGEMSDEFVFQMEVLVYFLVDQFG